jgi:spore coat polysaccharide biosynthesis protein SpsF (cytidylyltransferase family)
MKSVAVIVEARMTSRRLKKKHLQDLGGKPMIEQLLHRLTQSRFASEICLATSKESSDDALEDIASSCGVSCYRGSLNDVLSRVNNAVKQCGTDLVVEITGDCPLSDPFLVDDAIKVFNENKFDYLANMLDRLTFPAGFDLQIYGKDLLEEVERKAKTDYDRENVTSYIYSNDDEYKLANLCAPPELHRPQYWLCVDTQEDLDLIRKVWDNVSATKNGPYIRDVIAYLDREKHIMKNTFPGIFQFPKTKYGKITFIQSELT